jgi:hypothetical protein
VRYQNGWDRSGTITVPGATAVKVFYEVFKTEAGVDRLAVNGAGASCLSGRLGGFWSDAQTDNTISFRLTTGIYGSFASNMAPRLSGMLHNDYEIRVTRVKYLGKKTGDVSRCGAIWEDSREETFPLSGQVTQKVADAKPAVWWNPFTWFGGPEFGPVSGITVSFKTVEGDGKAPDPVVTDVRGNWCQIGFRRGSKYLPVFSKDEGDGTWSFTQPTIGDWRYRLYPVWAMFFQVFALICLILLYREWKRRGGDKGYTPPGV